MAGRLTTNDHHDLASWDGAQDGIYRLIHTKHGDSCNEGGLRLGLGLGLRRACVVVAALLYIGLDGGDANIDCDWSDHVPGTK